MAQRLIEAYIPDISWEVLSNYLKDTQIQNHWYEESYEGFLHVRILATEDSGTILDLLEKRFSHIEGFQVIVLPVEASIPRPKQKEEAEEESLDIENNKNEKICIISREELYADIEETSYPSGTYMAMVALSSIVAGIGILRNNTAIVIGAMVIAPLLGPNVALALSTTLADWKLACKALKSLGIGILIALVMSIIWGYIYPVHPKMPGFCERILIGPGDIVLGLASGCAGVLAFTSGAPATLVGVMVAVALLPPLVTCGLLIGAGYFESALGAILVFLTNIICINLSGVVTFMLKGVRPLKWWDSQKAKKALKTVIPIWILLLILLFIIISLSTNK